MSKHEKTVRRLLSKPADFGWNELTALMEALDYELKNANGSRRKFIHRVTGATHFIHEPHPQKILKTYQVRDLIAFLLDTGQIP